MLRIMLDSDDPTALDQSAHIVATYSDLIADPAAFSEHYTGRATVLIDRGMGDPSGQASVWDVERGAITVAQLPQKYDDAAARKVLYPTVYCSRDAIPSVIQAMGNRQYYLWVATADGTVFIAGHTPLRGPAAIQFAFADRVGIHADMSLVVEPGWHPTPALEAAQRNAQALTAALHAAGKAMDDADEYAHRLGQRLAELR